MENYKFTPIIVEKDKNRKILIDEEKLKELLKEAYTNGYMDGQASNIKGSPTPYNPIPYVPDVVPTTPTTPISPYYPSTSPYWYEKFYCTTSND